MGEHMHLGRRLIFPLPFLLMLAIQAAPGSDGEFLLPDQAFRISGQAVDPETVLVSWNIADGYYMYRSKLRFRSDTAGIRADRPRMPDAEIRHDDFFGEVEVYRGRVDVRVPLDRRAGAGDTLELETTSQGCADAGFCYPPHKQKLSINLPKLVAVAATSPEGYPESEAQAEPVPSPGTAAPDPVETRKRPALDSLAGLGRSLGVGMAEDILEPEEAFQFSAEVAAPDRLQLTWDIADGTYLYQDEIQIFLEDNFNVALGDYELPEAEIKPSSVRPDGTLGDVAVYHQRIDVPLPLLRRSTEPTSINLVVKYQGCAERGICYPPATRQVRLDLPAATSVTDVGTAQPSRPPHTNLPAVAGSAQPLSESDEIAAELAGGNLWTATALFFGFGLLLAFTPCVFPMIPILSGIIAGQGQAITTRKAFVLSLVYVLAMALTYTAAGVLAGLFGANLQATFQNPWILGLFALVFVALALSMFGFFELQLPSSLQSRLTEMSNRQDGGTLAGVAIMGLLSALVVGPCVAPPLAGALIFIGQTGDAVLGGTALFALSLGMGAPLIIVGTSAGKLLPKAGVWMDTIKVVFGVALLAVAIVLLERILPPAAAMALWGLLLIGSAIYLGALQQLTPDAGGWRKLWKGIGFFLLTYGVLMLIGAAAGGKDTLQPLRGLGLGASAEQHVAFKRVETIADLDREIATASAAGKPVMLDFYADWCVSCKEMELYTFSDPTVIDEMRRFVLLQADVTANDEQARALMQDRFSIPGPPAILFFDSEGRELRGFRVIGFQPPDRFAEHLRKTAP
jgi:thiol:disulfide interchange protein DsbD